MNVVSVILAALAVACFIHDQAKVTARVLFPLGLALLTSAWVLTAVWHTVHVVHF